MGANARTRARGTWGRYPALHLLLHTARAEAERAAQQAAQAARRAEAAEDALMRGQEEHRQVRVKRLHLDALAAL